LTTQTAALFSTRGSSRHTQHHPPFAAVNNVRLSAGLLRVELLRLAATAARAAFSAPMAVRLHSPGASGCAAWHASMRLRVVPHRRAHAAYHNAQCCPSGRVSAPASLHLRRRPAHAHELAHPPCPRHTHTRFARATPTPAAQEHGGKRRAGGRHVQRDGAVVQRRAVARPAHRRVLQGVPHGEGDAVRVVGHVVLRVHRGGGAAAGRASAVGTSPADAQAAACGAVSGVGSVPSFV
jgi:hypothetical protein